jgi:hypothetical protein
MTKKILYDECGMKKTNQLLRKNIICNIENIVNYLIKKKICYKRKII